MGETKSHIVSAAIPLAHAELKAECAALVRARNVVCGLEMDVPALELV